MGIRERIYRFFHRKEIRQKEEWKRQELAWKELCAHFERKCEEAKKDKLHYGEKPVFLDFGNGLMMPVPLEHPGSQWEVSVEEMKDGTLVPVMKEKSNE